MRQILGLRAAVSVVTAAGALLILSPIVPGFDVGGVGPALAAAAISGLLNGLLWPILARIALPLTVLTIGGAALVLNGAMLLLVAAIVPAMTIDDLGTAIIVTLAITALSTLVAAALSIDDDARFASHLARRRSRPSDPIRSTVPGVLFLEIDGLAHEVLQRALRDGHVPTLASWIADGDHVLTRWETDWSSQTGACQAGILHGDNEDMPAFRWWEKERGGPIVTNHPRDAAELERRVSDGRGLLHDDGASRANILSGDAPHSLLTMSTVLDVRRGKLGADYYTYFASPFNVARTLLLTIGDMATELWSALGQRRRDERPRVPRHLSYAPLRAFATAIQLDLQVEAVIGDIHAGPADRLHHLPRLRRGRSSLRDRARRRAGRAAPRRPAHRAHRARGRRRPAPLRADRPLRPRPDPGRDVRRPLRHHAGDARARGLRRRAQGDRHGARGRQRRGRRASSRPRWPRPRPATARRPARSAPSPGTAPRSRRRRRPTDKQLPEIVVMASGCLGLVSFPRLPGRVSRATIDTNYPALLSALLTHPGIGFVLVRDDDRGDLVLGAGGEHQLGDGAVTGADPLAPFGPRAAAHVARTARFPHCPDIMVNSTYWPQTEEVAAFEELVGSHGGLGGPQSFPFVLAPAALPVPGTGDRRRRAPAPRAARLAGDARPHRLRRAGAAIRPDRLTWLGHATVLLDLAGLRLLTDPVFGMRVAHLRRHVAAPAVPTDVDVVLLSHLHRDHADGASLRALGAGTRVVAPAGTAPALRRLGIRPTYELAAGDAVALSPQVTVRAIAAHHDGRRHPLGRPIAALGYLIEGPQRIYFAGDTDLFAGMAAARRPTARRRAAADLGLGPEARRRPPRSGGRRARGRAAGAAHRRPDPLGNLPADRHAPPRDARRPHRRVPGPDAHGRCPRRRDGARRRAGAWQRDHPARVSGRHPGGAQDGSALRPGPKPVAIVIPLRTLVTVVVFAAFVALAVLSAGTLLSIFVAAVLALGLDPPVSALVARGWRRGRAALATFAALFARGRRHRRGHRRTAVGPDRRLRQRAARLLGRAHPDRRLPATRLDRRGRRHDPQRAEGPRRRAAGGGDDDPRHRRRRVRLDPLARHLDLPGVVPVDGAPDDHRLAVRLHAAGGRAALAPGAGGVHPGGLQLADRQRRDLVVAATVAGLSAWALGLPFPIVLAVITGFLDLIPQIGATIAAVILVAVALTVSTPAAIAMLVIQLVYQQIENYIVYPLVYRRAVELSAFTTIVAVLIAGSLLGVVGAILADAVRGDHQDRDPRGGRAAARPDGGAARPSRGGRRRRRRSAQGSVAVSGTVGTVTVSVVVLVTVWPAAG